MNLSLPAAIKGIKPLKPKASWEQIPLGVAYGGGMLVEDLANLAAKASDTAPVVRKGKRLQMGTEWKDIFSNVGKALSASGEEIALSQIDAQNQIKGALETPLSKANKSAIKIREDAQKTLENLYPELNRGGKAIGWTSSSLPDYVMSGGKSKAMQAANTAQQVIRSFGNTPPDTAAAALSSIGIPGNSLTSNVAGNVVQTLPSVGSKEQAIKLIDLLLNSIAPK